MSATDFDLSRIRRVMASPEVVTAGLLSADTLAKHNAVLGELRQGERFALMTSVTMAGLLVTTAIRDDAGHFTLTAYLKADFGPAPVEAGVSLRVSF